MSINEPVLSRELNLAAHNLELPVAHAAVAARYVWNASSRRTRSVRREVTWRWTLKVLCTAACIYKKRWADPGDLKRCTLRSRRRVGWCEFSARLFLRKPRS